MDNFGTKRYGHPRFYEILEELANLHDKKNHDYAAGGHPLGNFYRRSKIYSLYPGLSLSDPAVIALTDMIKQLDAVLWQYSNRHKAMVEGKPERLRDISVYGVLAMVLEEEKPTDQSEQEAQVQKEVKFGGPHHFHGGQDSPLDE